MATATELKENMEIAEQQLADHIFLDEMGGAPGEQLAGSRKQLKELMSKKKEVEEKWEIDKTGGLGNWKIK